MLIIHSYETIVNILELVYFKIFKNLFIYFFTCGIWKFHSLGHICDLHWSLNPVSKAREQTYILMETMAGS